MTREGKIATLTAIIASGFVSVCMFYYYRGFYQHLVYPSNTFLVDGLFKDFTAVCEHWRAHQFNGLGPPYLPAALFFINALSWIPDPRLGGATLVTLVVIFAATYSYLNVKTDLLGASIRDTVICTLMAYPVLLEIVTANLEGILFAFLVVFVYAYKRGDYQLSALALAACIAMKGYPAVFAVVYLADKRYREMLALVQWTIVLSLVPLLIFQGGLQSGIMRYLTQLHTNFTDYAGMQIAATQPWTHSLLNGLQVFMGPHFPPMAQILAPYMIFAVVSFAALTYYVLFIERTFWKRIAVLTVAMCLLPVTSSDYKLLHFFIPLYLFINYRSSDSDWRFDALVVILFALLMVAKTWINLWNVQWNINIVLDPVIMLALVAAIVAQTLGKNKIAAPASV